MKRNIKKSMKNVQKIIKNNKKPIVIGAIGAGVVALAAGLGKAFHSMKSNATAQHEVDKANWNAAKAESKAQWEEAKAMGKPETRKKVMQAQRDEQIAEANKRKAEAEARIAAVGGNK